MLCLRYGHKRFECRTRSEDVSVSSGRIVCYVCNQPGHKSPNCPNRKEKDSSSNVNYHRGSTSGGPNSTASKPVASKFWLVRPGCRCGL